MEMSSEAATLWWEIRGSSMTTDALAPDHLVNDFGVAAFAHFSAGPHEDGPFGSPTIDEFNASDDFVARGVSNDVVDEVAEDVAHEGFADVLSAATDTYLAAAYNISHVFLFLCFLFFGLDVCCLDVHMDAYEMEACNRHNETLFILGSSQIQVRLSAISS